MALYSGIDLHSNNSYVVVSDEEDRILLEKRMTNDLGTIGRLSRFTKSWPESRSSRPSIGTGWWMA